MRGTRRRTISLLGLVVTGLLLAACGSSIKHPSANLVAGKQLFVSKCGSCHTLSHANTNGQIGPNLDDAFRQDRTDGYKSVSIQGLVDYWIRYPNTQGVMPQGLVEGQQAQDVAAYVGRVAAVGGQDAGALGQAGAVSGTTPAAGKQVFVGSGGCGSCHVLASAGTTGQTGPNLTQRLASDCANAQSKKVRGANLQKCIYTAITNPYAYLPAGYKAGIMPSTFSKTLKPNEITALVNYLASVTK
jgi:mono/diheme cytochrome c family protein